MKFSSAILLTTLVICTVSSPITAQEVIMGEASTENIIEGRLALYVPYSTSKKQIQEDLSKLDVNILNYQMERGKVVIPKGVPDEIEELFRNSPLVARIDTNNVDYQKFIDDRIKNTKGLTDEQKETLEGIKKDASERHLVALFNMNVDKDMAVRLLMSIEDTIKYKLTFSPRYIIVDIPKGKEDEYENKLNDLDSVEFVTYVAQHVDTDQD